MFVFSDCKLYICFSVQGQLEEHMAVLIVQSCHSFYQVAVCMWPGSIYEKALPAPALFPNKGMSERGVKLPNARP